MTNIIEKPKTNTLIEEYRQQALAYGHEKAIRTFATPVLQAWEKACEGYADEDTELEGFADLMSEVFNVRDAAIAAAINPRFKIGTIINLAAKAHTPYYKRLLFKTLVDGFTNPDIKPDHDRLHNAITAACGLTDLASEKKYRAHPLAVAAYLSWWDGKMEDAYSYAILALDADQATSLAALVLVALSKSSPSFAGASRPTAPPRTKRNQSTIHQKPKYQEKQYGIVHRHPRHPDPSARQSQS